MKTEDLSFLYGFISVGGVLLVAFCNLVIYRKFRLHSDEEVRAYSRAVIFVRTSVFLVLACLAQGLIGVWQFDEQKGRHSNAPISDVGESTMEFFAALSIALFGLVLIALVFSESGWGKKRLKFFATEHMRQEMKDKATLRSVMSAGAYLFPVIGRLVAFLVWKI